jgi:hypothetical protein
VEPEPAEAEGSKVMRAYREYVMTNYKIVNEFGWHVLFEPK